MGLNKYPDPEGQALGYPPCKGILYFTTQAMDTNPLSHTKIRDCKRKQREKQSKSMSKIKSKKKAKAKTKAQHEPEHVHVF